MVSRYRFPRSVILIVIMMVFSLTLVGQTDNRLHIGGADWDYDGLYVEYHEFYRVAAEEPQYGTIGVSSAEAAIESSLEAPQDLPTGLDGGETPVKIHTTPAASELRPEEQAMDTSVDASEASVKEEAEAAASGLAAELEAEVDRGLPVLADAEEPKDEPADKSDGIVEDAVDVAKALVDEEEAVQIAVENSPDVQEAEPAEEAAKPEPKRSPIHVHTVKSGETLWDIAQAYGITVDTILSANDISNSNRIRVGQELEILTVQGVLHPVAVGESLWEIARRYDVSVDAITAANEISDPSRIQPRDRLVIPGATRLRPRDVLVVNGQLQKAFDWPTRGRISSPFGPRWGRMHNGIDIAVPTGTPIRAAANGTISFAGWNGGYGYLVIIDHGNNVETRYAHNSRLPLKAGTRVERGQIIAHSGNTGNSTGPHLHFEIRHRGNPVDPMRFLR